MLSLPLPDPAADSFSGILARPCKRAGGVGSKPALKLGSPVSSDESHKRGRKRKPLHPQVAVRVK